MDAVKRQPDHDREVGQQQGGVEQIPVVEPLEGLVRILHFEVVAEAVLGRKGERRSHSRRQSVERSGGIQTGHKRGEQGKPPQSDY